MMEWALPFICGWASGASIAMGAALLVVGQRPVLGPVLILVGVAVGMVWASEST